MDVLAPPLTVRMDDNKQVQMNRWKDSVVEASRKSSLVDTTHPSHSHVKVQSDASWHIGVVGKPAFDLSQLSDALAMYVGYTQYAQRPWFPCNSTSIGANAVLPMSMQYPQQSVPYGPSQHGLNCAMPAPVLQPLHYPAQQYGQPLCQYQPAMKCYPMHHIVQPPNAGYGQHQYTTHHMSFSPRSPRVATAAFHPLDNYINMANQPRQLHSPVPALPRGPPRKPKQSGNALWVGNLPLNADICALKDHFSRDARQDIESLFLISKSNCAFVNYRSAVACAAAMVRFHESRFGGMRLLCRLRRDSALTLSNDQASPESTVNELVGGSSTSSETPDSEQNATPVIADGARAFPPSQTGLPDSPTIPKAKMPDQYFVMKSLTTQDLQASVRNGVWATQSHNEATLNRAFENATNVYLIFSANKTGRYYGYARMSSLITGAAQEDASLSTTQLQPSSEIYYQPRSISTAATYTAPSGHIIDDSVRGTIFWESDLPNPKDGTSSPARNDSSTNAAISDTGRPFNITWISTRGFSMYAVSGLRNPWNANREVKIARDGTELEPSIGKRLLSFFHRPMTTVAAAGLQTFGFPQPPGLQRLGAGAWWKGVPEGMCLQV